MPIIRKSMPELDTLRGVAVLMVVLFHGFGFLVGPYELRQYSMGARLFIGTTWLGWMGVNLFFVLSGFLITGILLREKEKPKYFSRFYWRRALRILPAYYLLLLLLPVICSIPGFPRHMGWKFLGFSFVYAANLVDFFGVQMQYGPLWSLAVEEHFYLVWPTVVKAVSSTMLVAVALAVIAVSPALRIWAPGMAGVTWKNLDGLAMGAIAAVIALRHDRRGIKFLCMGCFGAALSGAVLLIPWKVYLSSSPVGTGFKTTLVDLFFAGVLSLFLLAGTSRWKALVNLRPLQFYGFISYGLYLLHMLVFDAYDAAAGHRPALGAATLGMRFLVVLSVSTLLCWISRRTFEEFFLGLKDKVLAVPERRLANAASSE